jgi:epoxyqueuosine reductase
LRLTAKAHELGFNTLRVVAPSAIPEAPQRLAQWLNAGAQGDMQWMAETAERRANPLALWGDTRSIIMLAMNYAPSGDPLATLGDQSAGNISVYARHRDYHDVIKGKLRTLAAWLHQASAAQADNFAVKVFVDTAPVMEKPLAAAAGVGWQGKHTNLVSRDFGSWLFLGSIFTTLNLEPDAPETDHCGSCRACLDVCPTNAFPAPYQLDARRCISYLTIEHKGHIPSEFRTAMGNRIYGCDDCLAVCPWNKYAQTAREAKLAARDDMMAPKLAELARLDDVGFRRRFSGSPVKRIGSERFMRNLMIAIGNSRDASLREIACEKLRDASPLVRAMAVWAVGKLFAAEDVARLKAQHMRDETDPDVRAEWAELELS